MLVENVSVGTLHGGRVGMCVASFFIFSCYGLLYFTARLEFASDSAMASAVPMMECVPAGDSDERLNSEAGGNVAT